MGFGREGVLGPGALRLWDFGVLGVLCVGFWGVLGFGVFGLGSFGVLGVLGVVGVLGFCFLGFWVLVEHPFMQKR